MGKDDNIPQGQQGQGHPLTFTAFGIVIAFEKFRQINHKHPFSVFGV
jgi:hypothetical protein